MTLSEKHCVPCRKDMGALSPADAETFLKALTGWELIDAGKMLSKRWTFKNFAQALAFVNRIGEIAETENHHPDIAFGWGYVTIRLQTHRIGGLHENDFILAAKIDKLQ